MHLFILILSSLILLVSSKGEVIGHWRGRFFTQEHIAGFKHIQASAIIRQLGRLHGSINLAGPNQQAGIYVYGIYGISMPGHLLSQRDAEVSAQGEIAISYALVSVPFTSLTRPEENTRLNSENY
ncbi:hypothetical protein PRIPAC_86781 [Pristionchus pacificus]|uniref:Uncharacterized protein n=1 Tax=Pristionchus pacificus TaxID=54126 RepID=A0A2A6BH04_PRIPA|nr:hypothetical protein PRIPAC_86781 [Pristionchus pacificus]|eukprot:PDM65116.1 hypothetical protein PRIPAC_53365 [Pristionchus pacificus]